MYLISFIDVTLILLLDHVLLTLYFSCYWLIVEYEMMFFLLSHHKIFSQSKDSHNVFFPHLELILEHLDTYFIYNHPCVFWVSPFYICMVRFVLFMYFQFCIHIMSLLFYPDYFSTIHNISIKKSVHKFRILNILVFHLSIIFSYTLLNSCNSYHIRL